MPSPSYEAPTAAVIAQAREALAALDPALARAHRGTPVFEWRLRPSGFAALLKLVVEQQVSIASAAAIWGRLQADMGEASPHAVLARGEGGLRGFGFSGQKARYALDMARADLADEIDFEGLRALDDDAAIAALTRLRGVGRWTAQTYLMFSEGRLDVFPAGDVALQHGLRMAAGLAAKPAEAELQARAERWRPYRGVAAHLLWGYYGAVRRGELSA